MATIRNGVPAGDPRPASVDPQRPGGATPMHLLFVGRLTNWKGVETLLLALDGLAGVEATIVGDGPAYPHLVELAAQLRLQDRVRFAGREPESAVSRRMASADVLVLTSLTKACPTRFSKPWRRGSRVSHPVVAATRNSSAMVAKAFWLLRRTYQNSGKAFDTFATTRAQGTECQPRPPARRGPSPLRHS